MKLQLEFEDSDLREMVQGYFARNGFAVKNLDQLCELFHKAFPDGISVQAETLAQKQVNYPDGTTVAPATGEHAATPLLPEEEYPPPTKTDDRPQTVMTASDLFDPTPGNVPTRDEQLRQSQKEVAYLVAQSKAIEEEKAKEKE